MRLHVFVFLESEEGMPLSKAFHEDTCQKQKLCALAFAGTVLISIALCSLARFVPVVDDHLSGAPEYVRSITNMMAEDLTKKFAGRYPVIVIESDEQDCQPVQPVGSVETADIDLISYSELFQSLCVTQGRTVNLNAELTRTIIVSQATGLNYGRRLEAPVRVVPIQRYPAHFPSTFLSSFHWRARPAPEDLHGMQLSQLPDSLIQQELRGFSIDIVSLRKKVAERHNATNRLLSLCLGSMILAFLAVVYRLRFLHHKLRRHCRLYGFDLTFSTYLNKNASEIANCARASYYTKHGELLAQVRAEKISHRAEHKAREGLLALFQTTRDGQQRARIQSCLGRCNLAEMQNLLHDLESHLQDRTPEERLDSLLESLKEYCVEGEEVEVYRKEAFEIFRNHGFRNAREFLVHAHEELRFRARESERRKIAEKSHAQP